jgi:hypothetical protein
MAAAWPARAGDPFADRMNAMPKYVVSETLGDGDLVVIARASCAPSCTRAWSTSSG